MTTKDQVAEAILETLVSPNESDSNFESANVVDGLFAIAHALNKVAQALERLGTNDAATPMGAIEMLSLEIKNGFEKLAMSREEIS